MTKLYRYHTGENFVCAAVSVPEGARKWAQVVYMDGGPLRVRRVPIEDVQYMHTLLRNGKPYPGARAYRGFMRYAKASGRGITKGAKAILAGLRVSSD